ncbi:MAG: FecR domain-containing protein [Prosthecobacter sp.]
MNKLSLAITLAVATQVTSLEAGVFSFLTGKGRSQGNQVTTSAGSRAEAKVDKNGSIVRVGSNTAAKVSDNGTVTLSKGVMLVSSGEGFLRRPSVQISTPQGDVTVRGSAIVAALPDGSVKMTVLEGSARGALGGKDMALNPGQLMIQRNETRDAVKVDLSVLASSSSLLDASQYQLPLPAAPIIRQEVVQQTQSMGATLTLSGGSQNGGNQVVNAADLKLAKNGQSPSPISSSASAVTVSGGTLRVSNSSLNSTLGTGTATLNAAASNVVQSYNGTTRPLTLNPGPGPAPAGNAPTNGQQFGSSLTISGSDIVLNGAVTVITSNGIPLNSTPVSLSQANTLALGGSGATTTTPGGSTVSAGSLHLSGGTAAINRSSAGSLVLTPGSTLTGQLTVAGGATLSGGTVIVPGATGTANLPAAGSTTTDSGSSLVVTSGISSGALANRSGAFQLLDWTGSLGSSLNFSGTTGAAGTAATLPDLTHLSIGSWDTSMFMSQGIIVVVGPGYTGPGSTVPGTTTTTTTPPATTP